MADSARTALDIGGTWNGSAEIALGDTLAVQITNTGSGDAFDLTLAVDMPAGFQYAAGSAQGLPGISASQAGQTLTFSLPMNTDVASGMSETISFGVVADLSVTAGAYSFDWNIGFGTVDGATDGATLVSGQVQVQEGASVLSVTPIQQVAAVGDQVSWVAVVENTGLGGLFDVAIDEALLTPMNAADSLGFVSITELSPGGFGVTAGPRITFPYLAPGDEVSVTVVANVIGCNLIDNPVATTDRTLATAGAVTASITLDVAQPLINVVTSTVSPSFGGGATFSGSIDHVGMGPANDLIIGSNLAGLAFVVTGVSADWSYDPGSGAFTYTPNGGSLMEGVSANLDFMLSPVDSCAGAGASTIIWSPTYSNDCDDSYATPIVTSSIEAVTGQPSVGVAVDSGVGELAINASGQYELTLNWTERDFIATDPLVVQQLLPETVQNVVPGTPTLGSVSCPSCDGGSLLSWSIPLSSLPSGSGSTTLTVDFTVSSDPCDGGTLANSSVNIVAESVVPPSGSACTLDAADADQFLVSNGPSGALAQEFSVQVPGDGIWETGAFDDGNGVRDDALGEGEFITYTASYSFGAPYAGTWAGSTFKDFLAELATQQYVTGSAMVSVDGGALQPLTVSAPDAPETGIKIDLAQIAAIAGSPDVEGHSILISYQTVATDAALGGAATRSFLELVRLTVGSASGDSDACNMGEFNQGAGVTIGRGQALIAPQMPGSIDVCEEFDVTLNVSNGTPLAPSNILVTLFTSSDYEVIAGQTPTYTGDFDTNTVTYSENLASGVVVNPTFELAPGVELENGGAITVRVRRSAMSGTDPTPITARVDYDDHEEKPTSARDFVSNGSDSPFLVREASFNLGVTPQTVTVVDSMTEWRVVISNGGAGTAYESNLTDVVPSGLTPNKALTDAANSSIGAVADVVGQTISWDLGEIPSGESRTLIVICDAAGNECDIPAGQNSVTASWGCGVDRSETLGSTDPNFSFASSALQVAHDRAVSEATLCEETGSLVVIARSVGAGHVNDVVVTEELATATSGLSYVAGSSTYSTDGTTFMAILGDADVAPNGTATWDKDNVPELAELASGTSASAVNTVYIRFSVSASETASTVGGPVTANASGSAPCGEGVTAPGSIFAPPLLQADMTVDVVGENITDGDAAAATVYGTPGDAVRWTVTLDNRGENEADNGQMRLTFPGSGTTTGTLTLPGGGTQSITSGTWFSVTDVADGAVDVYTLDYALGTTCVEDGTLLAEFTWGCSAVPATSSNALSEPTSGTASASLNMLPDFSGSGLRQSRTNLSNGRLEVRVTLENGSATASSMVLDVDLSGFELDATFAPTVTGSLALTSVTYPTASQSAPRFQLSGDLERDENAVVTFRTVPTQGFDSLSDLAVEPESSGNGDSPRAANGSSMASLSYDDDCGTGRTETDSLTLNPAAVDVDLLVDVDSVVVTPGEQYVFNFDIVNNGESNSVAEAISLTPQIGAGWSGVTVEVITPGDGGSGGTCAGDCAEIQIGSLARNQTAVVRVTATANDNGSSLALAALVTGRTLFDDGSATGNVHSLDARRSAAVGVTLAQTISSTSETFTSEAGVARPVAVGEEVTYSIEGRWFGTEPTTGLAIHNTLPAELGFVSSADTGSTVTYNLYTGPSGTTPPAHADTGLLRFVIDDLPSGSGTFTADLVARVLNADTTSGSVLTNPTGTVFSTFAMSYASDNAQDGLSGDVMSPRLHAETMVLVERPTLEVVTLVRNVTAGQVTYSTDTMGDAGDVLEYQTVVTNSGDTTAFDVVVTEDPASSKLLIQDGAADGIDNDGDGTPDDGSDGTFVAGADGTVTFDATHNSDLGELGASASVTLLYRAVISSGVTPTESLVSSVAIAGAGLDGGVGSQSGDVGALGDPDGAEELTDTGSAAFEADMIVFAKSLISTSDGSDTDTSVLVGEIAQYRVTVVLPEGEAPGFKVLDDLSSGLALVATPDVSYGWASPPSQPAITPAVLPASGGATALEYDFGNLMVPAGTDAERTITIDFFAQVENVAANVSGQSLGSTGRYEFGSVMGANVAVTLDIVEPSLTATIASMPDAAVNAGSTATYTVTLTNPSSSVARDVDVRFTLPANTTYVPSSTTAVSGPALGEPEVMGGVVIWGRSQASPAAQDLDVDAAGGNDELQFTFEVELGDGVRPDQTLSGALAASWTSLDGPTGTSLGGVSAGAAGTNLGERDGSGTTNDYSVGGSSQFDVANVYANRVTASGDTVARGGFRIGDLVTYTIEIDVQEGTTNGFVIEDVLPSGLAFFDAQVISPGTGVDGFTFTEPAGANAPTSGDTGTLSWSLGSVVNEGDNNVANDTLVLVYRARVLDAGGISVTPTVAARADSVRLRYEDADGNSESLTAASDSIDVKQPLVTAALALDSGQMATVGASEPVRYQATLTNAGDAGAYNAALQVQLPEGLRDAAPTVVSATLAGVSVTLAPPVYDALSGVATWSLADGQELPAGALNELVVIFEATTDADMGAGLSMSTSAAASTWFSKPSSDSTERREYGPSVASAAAVSGVVPTDLTKTVGATGATIGAEFTYTITVPGTTVDAALFDVNVLDALPDSFSLVSVATNAAGLGATFTDSSSGQALSYLFSAIPANTQATVELTVRVNNVAINQDTLQVINTARYTYASTSAGDASAEISADSPPFDILEPNLNVDLSFDRFVIADAAQGLQAGDRAIYNVVVTNDGDAPAYDIVIDSLASEKLISPLVTAEPDNPGAATTVGTNGGITTYRWTVPGPLPPAGTYSFEVSLELSTSVQPMEMLSNGAATTWTSLAGVDANERTGADGEGGALNDYGAAEDAPVSITVGNIILTKSEAAGGDATYAPGEVVQYDLTFTAGQGTIQEVVLRDFLPAGLVFDSATLSATNYTQPGGSPVAFLNEPSVGDTGTLDFDFGDLVSAGAGPLVEVSIFAHLADVPSNAGGAPKTNSAQLLYEDPDDPAQTVTVDAQSSPVITVIEPAFGVSLDAPADGDLGDELPLVLRVDNGGDGPAWQPTLVAFLPVGLRTTDPLAGTFTVSVVGGRDLTLVAGVDYTTSYDPSTGRLQVSLIGAGGRIDGDETLQIEMVATIDENAVDGADLTVVATVTEAFSTDTTAGTPDGLRTYATAFGTGTTGTANGATGDDETDDASTEAQLPVVAMVKSVSNDVAEAGTALSYQLTLTNTGAGATQAATFVDDLDVNIMPGTLANVTVVPELGNLGVDPSGGTNGSGQVRIENLVLAANSSVVINFDCSIRRPLPDGTEILNQARLSIPFFSEPVLSDSANPADNDGINTGNDPGDGDDDDGAKTTIGARPVFIVTKSDMDADGAPLMAGDTLTYQISVENVGNENAVDSVLSDAIPGTSSYVPGSTTLNGAGVNDVGGTSALVNGLAIQSPGAASGSLEVDRPAVVTFQVVIEASLQPGTQISNQATLVGSGVASGVQAPVKSDDPDTVDLADPTLSVVGGGASLDANKSVVDVNGGTVAVGDVLTYTIRASNLGDTASTGVVLRDSIPQNVTYVAESMRYDVDGSGSYVSVTDAADSDVSDAFATLADGLALIRGDLAGGDSFAFEFQVTVDGAVSDGMVLSNQGVLSSDGAPDTFTDDDSTGANGEQSTDLVVGSDPVLRLTKEVLDLNGGAVEPGDVLRYVMEMQNIGAGDAESVTVTDPLPPAGTIYVPGSTRLNGSALSDAGGGDSPLIAGVALGTLEPQGLATLFVDVQVLGGELPGTVITNQALYGSSNAGSGVSDSGLDDLAEGGNDAGDPNDDDPTSITVGGRWPIATVGGSVWRDFDHDRIFTPPLGALGRGGVQSDVPLGDWTIEVLLGGVVVASTVSGPDGNWLVTGLDPGHGYALRFLHPETGTTFGNPESNYPGSSTAAGQIDDLFLAPGSNVLEQNLPIDPAGVLYNAVTRQPVAGGVATLSGPPGFDPSVHLAPQQQGQITGSDGYYQFDLLAGFPAGTYTLSFAPPLGYLPTFPSTLLEPAAGPLDPTGVPNPFLVVPNNLAPEGAEPTLYYLDFDLESGDPNVLNNHVALDPILEGSIALTKTTPKQNVVKGDLVPWTIRAQNLLAVPLPPSEITDLLPPGFKYIPGSGLVDGVPAEPTVDGRSLTWSGIDFQPGAAREVVLITVVGAGVQDGRYLNTAAVREPFSQENLSNVGTAEVFVVPDPILDCSDVLGKVFHDHNGNGYQDEGEPGIAGVRIATARGLVVTTDAYGRYHIACPELSHEMRGSNFILKIDERTLPTGFAMTTENPRVVRLTRGKFVEADFGAAPSRTLHMEIAASAFAETSEESADAGALNPEWFDVLRLAVEEVQGGGSAVLRISYVAGSETEAVASTRLEEAVEKFRSLWVEDGGSRGQLTVEREILRPAASTQASLGVDAVTFESNPAQQADRTLADADIRVQADGLEVTPRLNVVAVPNGINRSGSAAFSVYSNYWSWISSAEVRLFAPNKSTAGEPLAVIPVEHFSEVGSGAAARRTVADLPFDEILYVVRVVGAQGRYDETEAKVLRIVPDEAFDLADDPAPEEYLVGYGESHLARQRIPVKGGAVTVSARNLSAGSRAWVDGYGVPVDSDGTFVTQIIAGEGNQAVMVRLEDESGAAVEAMRELTFPKDEWFYVALADLTVGGGSSSSNAALVTGDDQLEDSVYVNGRLAFYLKGKIKGEHLLTVSVDTQDRPLDEILSGLDERDPSTLLRYIDPDRFYPVYGDDSVTAWDAPTQGRFFVRLERDDYEVLWGNFKTQMLETELAQVDRGLYGFRAKWRDRDETSFGEAQTSVEAFAASPDSAAAREELRGTGGSLYYLRHRDLVIGSERVRIEVRDKDSGIVMSVQPLVGQQDYDIDYLAGRVLLTQPLASTAGDGFAVQNSSLAGNPVYLVARYEFVPQGGDFDALSAGGRVSHWLNDSLQVGATLDHQDQTGGDRDLYGLDVTWRKSATTYLKAEFAASEGPGSGELTSVDGGFSFGAAGGALDQGSDGTAFRVEGAVDLEENSLLGLDGNLHAVVQQREGGFSGTGLATQGDSTQVNVSLVEPLGENQSLRVELDVRDEDLRTSATAIDAQYERRFDDGEWLASLGLRHDDLDAGAFSGSGARDGSRDDLALRLAYDGFDSGTVYGFGQATVARSGQRSANHRYGIGGEYALSSKVTLDGEISGGSGGLGLRGGTKWGITDRTDLYLAYGLDADRSDVGLGAQNGRRNGTLTMGAKHRYSDTLSVFGEERYQHGDGPAGLTHVYGAEYSPNDRWTGGILVENGQLEEAGQIQLERTGISINAGYVHDKTRVATALEWRDDESASGERQTWLMRNTAAYQVNPDWRLLGNLDVSRSDGNSTAFQNADFTEVAVGWAHRPVAHERWNALLRYTYHEDLPSPAQVNAFGGTVDFAQRSHVLSADANYDLARWLTVGGKVGMRYGELKATKGPGTWFDSRALLYGLRADLHVVRNWDAILETRFLDVEAAEDSRLGALASIWRHLGDSGKLGVGYSFADFSDDLTDLGYDHQGWFLNLVGKF
jgi:uncharacterized repeat protein (TIGR01451 family)/fimbrial isopeptide formation D2 family protein